MLCFEHSDKFGEICTNRCEKRQECEKNKNLNVLENVPMLVEASDRLVSGAYFGEIMGLPVITFDTYGISPEGYINDAVNEFLISRLLAR